MAANQEHIQTPIPSSHHSQTFPAASKSQSPRPPFNPALPLFLSSPIRLHAPSSQPSLSALNDLKFLVSAPKHFNSLNSYFHAQFHILQFKFYSIARFLFQKHTFGHVTMSFSCSQTSSGFSWSRVSLVGCSGLLPICVNKVLLAPSHSHSFTYCL